MLVTRTRLSCLANDQILGSVSGFFYIKKSKFDCLRQLCGWTVPSFPQCSWLFFSLRPNIYLSIAMEKRQNQLLTSNPSMPSCWCGLTRYDLDSLSNCMPLYNYASLMLQIESRIAVWCNLYHRKGRCQENSLVHFNIFNKVRAFWEQPCLWNFAPDGGSLSNIIFWLDHSYWQKFSTNCSRHRALLIAPAAPNKLLYSFPPQALSQPDEHCRICSTRWQGITQSRWGNLPVPISQTPKWLRLRFD